MFTPQIYMEAEWFNLKTDLQGVIHQRKTVL